MITHIIEGVGFGSYGPEESSLIFIDEDGYQVSMEAHHFLPIDGRVQWAKLEALMDGFGSDHRENVLDREGRDLPTAYRMKITVEYEPLSVKETQELLDKAKARNEKLDADA